MLHDTAAGRRYHAAQTPLQLEVVGPHAGRSARDFQSSSIAGSFTASYSWRTDMRCTSATQILCGENLPLLGVRAAQDRSAVPKPGSSATMAAAQLLAIGAIAWSQHTHTANLPSLTSHACRSTVLKLQLDTARPQVLLRLAAFGGAVGPLVDAVHNQVLLKYDVLPVQLPLLLGTAQTSLIIPPLLAITYALLGGLFPALAQQLVGNGSLQGVPAMSSARRAGLAVASTVLIIKASEICALALPAKVGLVLLYGMCTLQWAVLDGAFASALLALLVSVAGPVAELPFIWLGAWHYLPESSDYYPLARFGIDAGWAGLAAITAPCYFAVTTDAIALGRFFSDLTSKREG
eukprot:3485874-Pleurochrysis_carterae.AAC.2